MEERSITLTLTEWEAVVVNQVLSGYLQKKDFTDPRLAEEWNFAVYQAHNKLTERIADY